MDQGLEHKLNYTTLLYLYIHCDTYNYYLM